LDKFSYLLWKGMTHKKTVGSSKVKQILARKKRELSDDGKLELAQELLSVASSKIQKPAVIVPQRRSSPTDWRRENSPQRLWEDLETFM
jgi:hypothetical protein